jgi:light-regulated signal transduction histidine kinase (bacteriophytochrome)
MKTKITDEHKDQTYNEPSKLVIKVDELTHANNELREARRAALNLMEDAILSKEALRKSEKALKHNEAHLEKLVAERTQQLKQTINQLESFNYIASHDLQEPLRKIRTYVKLLNQSGPESPELIAYTESIYGSAERMSRLIDSLLQYSRNTRTEDAFQTVDLNEILENVKADYEITIHDKQAVLKSSPLPVIRAIPFQMHQLFSNLIGNSLKFSNGHPAIEIDSSTVMGCEIPLNLPEELHNKKYTRLIFTDHGIGFDNKYREKIFQIFQRLHTRTDYDGTGIGLSIVLKIIHQHNGYIKAEGELTKGAVFNIYLPLLTE